MPNGAHLFALPNKIVAAEQLFTKARNIMERLPKSLHASVRCVLRQTWELDDAAKAERLLRNLAQRLQREWSGGAGSILEGIDEILTVTRLGLRRSCGARSPVPTSSRMP